MLTNNDITYYSKVLNKTTRLEEWQKTTFNDVWLFGRKGSLVSTGYTDSDEVDVRIPLDKVQDTSIFKIGDIVAVGIQDDIEKQSDLEGIEFYNITGVNVNNFGNNKHIHLKGR